MHDSEKQKYTAKNMEKHAFYFLLFFMKHFQKVNIKNQDRNRTQGDKKRHSISKVCLSKF